MSSFQLIVYSMVGANGPSVLNHVEQVAITEVEQWPNLHCMEVPAQEKTPLRDSKNSPVTHTIVQVMKSIKV